MLKVSLSLATHVEVIVMRRPLTAKQQKILDFIIEQIQGTGYPPTVREIGAAFKISEKGAHDHLIAIEKKKYIRRDARKPRAIEVLEYTNKKLPTDAIDVPIIGRVAAGEPLFAIENVEGRLPLPSQMVKNEKVFALRIKGSSMINAGIMDGDFVIVRQQKAADAGDIVVALLGDEATVKRFYRDNGAIRLQPENPDMEPIIARDVNIVGKVIGLFRQM